MSTWYALWIPVLTTNGLRINGRRVIYKNLSDTEVAFNVKAEIDDSFSVRFYYQEKPVANLSCYGHNQHGFLLYELTECDDKVFATLRTKMPTPIYHLIKDFFHEHIFHSKNEDSLLVPCVSNNRIDPDNLGDVYHHYLSRYEEKIRYYRDEIKELSDNLVALIQKSAGFNKGLNQAYPDLKNLSEKAKGEHRFCSYLITVSGDFPLCRPAIANMEPLIAQINYMMCMIEFRMGVESTKLSLRIGRRGVLVGIFGFLVGLISIIFW